jgi:hypothetical protein
VARALAGAARILGIRQALAWGMPLRRPQIRMRSAPYRTRTRALNHLRLEGFVHENHLC